MFDVEARDGAARTGAFSLDDVTVRTPLVLYPHTEDRAAPDLAEAVVSRRPHPSKPTFVYRGTQLTAGDGNPDVRPGFVDLPRALIYPPEAGRELLVKASAINEATSLATHASVMLDPSAETERTEIVVAANARTRLADPWRFPEFIVHARAAAGYNALVYTPGLGLPDEQAILAYAGVDVMDATAGRVAAAKGLFATTEGLLRAEGLDEWPCACPGCLDDDLELHNHWAIEAERRRVVHAIEHGRLRELVEVRVRARPELVAILRRFDAEHFEHFEARAPITRTTDLKATGEASLTRPEVARWVRRIEERYTPPPSSRILVVVPCSATKPYSNSPTHHRIDGVLRKHGKGRAHKVVLTSPLGAVPEEMELAYPASHYDIPFTGSWTATEHEHIRRTFSHLVAGKFYDHVVVHLDPTEAALVTDVAPDAVVTGGERPTSPESLDSLAAALNDALDGVEPLPTREMFAEQMTNRAVWQFGGEAGRALTDGVTVRGRYPRLKLFNDDGQQVAMLHPKWGHLVLTMHGGERIGPTGAYTVDIHDFTPSGSVFAVGITDASDEVRVGDEVVVVHGDEVRAVGTAAMNGAEMREATRGAAVETRHHA